MNTSPLATRRPLILAASWIAVLVWSLLRYAAPEIAHMGRFTYPAWLALVALYTLDRPLRFRLLYEGMLGTVAYFLLHDIPMHLKLEPLRPATTMGLQMLLVCTGALAALPFGRRGPGVAAVAGTLLGALWVVYRVERVGFAAQAVPTLRNTVFLGAVFMTLGGLLCERLTRRWRGDAEAPGASAALWGFVLGAAFALTLARW